MTDSLLVCPAGPERWLWWRPGGAPFEGGLDVLKGAAAGRAVLLLAPGEEVLLTEATVSARRRRELERAVPFALEDQLLGELEDLRFAFGEPDASGRLAVAVIGRERAEALAGPLRQAGIRLQALLAEPLALTLRPGEWTVLSDGRRVIARTGPTAGFALETDAAVAALGASLQTVSTGEGATGVPRVRLYLLAGADGSGLVERLREAGLDTLEVQSLDSPASVLEAPTGPPLALDLAPAASSAAAAPRIWVAAAALLLAALLLHAGALGYRLSGSEARLETLRAGNETLFREAFPQVGRLVDLRLQGRRELQLLRERVQAREAFLELLLAAGRARGAAPALEIAALGFGQGTVRLDLASAEPAALRRYREALDAPGLRVNDLGRITLDDGRMAQRLELSEVPAP